jgi:hypothetical protein
MAVLIRPRFGQHCFDCGDQAIQRIAESQRRRWLKSDLACVLCANKREITDKAGPKG